MISEDIEKYIIKTFGLNSPNGYKVSKLSEGLSGAEVYILEILAPRRQRDRGIYILKEINTVGKWYNKDKNEADISKAIYNEAIKFQRNLVKVIKNEIVGDKLVLILSYAFGSQISSISMTQLMLDNKLDMLEQISYDLLDKLNYCMIEYTFDCKMIENLCSYRIEEKGNFFKRLKKNIYEMNKPAISINGKIFPNPNYYLKKLKEILQSKNFQYILGILHGDLHQKNILTLKNNSKYVIIDYDSCSKNYLLFDQAYLELNIYMQISEKWDLNTWMNGLEYAFQVQGEGKKSAEFASIEKVEYNIRSGIDRWYNENVPNIIDSFHVQLQLARIAAGINYFSKSGIDNLTEQIKYLIYICYGFSALFSLIEFDWDKNNVSRLIDRETNYNYTKTLWNECGKLRNEYIKILITDDDYDDDKYQILSNIGEIDWRLIVDVGRKKTPNDLITPVVPCIRETNSIKFVNDDNYISTIGNTNILQVKIGEHMTLFEHWSYFREKFIPIYKTVCSSESLKSVLFVLDFHGDNYVRDRFIEMLWEENLIRNGSRFVCLGVSHNLPLSKEELKNRNVYYFEHQDMNLEDLVRVIDDYGLHRQKILEEICLPCLESLDGRLTKEEWNDYNSVVEIVYPGAQNNQSNYTDGEEFYKGNEITWLDLEQKKDVEWRGYENWKKIILKKLQTERISECMLLHGAGAGGTTLSKRLMWDIKDINPTLRIRKYSHNTVNVIIDIYRKTGKCVFVVLEMGSTIISEEEFEIMKTMVNAQSCHALFLKVERTMSNDDVEKSEIYLSEDLEEQDAKKFHDIYYTKTENIERHKYLDEITYNFMEDEWRGQCCPFFYGFYTFQEEYQGLGRFLMTSIERCDEKIKRILADLSIITIYSQNICMSYEEIAKRLELEEVNLVDIFKKLDDAIGKILVQKSKGFRICHSLIAKKLLELIYSEYKLHNERLYYATINFIDNMSVIYDKEMDREYIDKIFKELFIDRSYIDGEQQKFAPLISDFDKHSSKINVFNKLIEMYKDNPHYYNHLGRLQVYLEDSMQFDKAIGHLKKAISIANEKNLSQVPHYTTLGCIYSKKVIYEMDGGEKTIENLVDGIAVDFGNANDCFKQARILKENSTYAYFPNILMICNVVKKISRITKGGLKSLLRNDIFEKWYNCYSGVAVQLFEQMKRNCDEELSEELRKKAEDELTVLKENINEMKNKLLRKRSLGGGLRECSNLGRTISMLLYMKNDFKWEGMETEDLLFAEKEMEKILEGGEYKYNDVVVWFNIYRQMNNFDIDKAKRYILDYMDETYYKNYIMWILSFLQYEKGILAYSKVDSYLKECRYSKQIAENNIRTTRNIDAYTLDETEFPIRKMNSIRIEKGEYLDLKTFKGQIIDIDGTVKGKIRMDGLDDIVVTFIPSFTVGDEKREFTRDDISSRVEFKLAFTYSGYRALDPQRI